MEKCNIKVIDGIKWKVKPRYLEANFLYNRYDVWKFKFGEWFEVKKAETKKRIIGEFLNAN